MKIVYLLLGIMFICSCNQEVEGDTKYIHLSHIRLLDTVTQRVDPRVEKMDLSDYAMILLGGDLAEETSKKRSTMEYMDDLFDLDAETTLLAQGNHDNANLDLVKEFTGRDTSYFYKHNDITFLVFYTQEGIDWKCHITNGQLDNMNNAIQQLGNDDYLIVMTHKLIWLKGNEFFEEDQGTGYYNWTCNYGIDYTNWYKDIYPELLKVQKAGTQVICLAGDVGNNVQSFEKTDPNGIIYLASGFSVKDRNLAKFIEFNHDLESGELTWEFVNP